MPVAVRCNLGTKRAAYLRWRHCDPWEGHAIKMPNDSGDLFEAIGVPWPPKADRWLRENLDKPEAWPKTGDVGVLR